MTFEALGKKYSSNTKLWNDVSLKAAKYHLVNIKEVLNTGLRKNNFSLQPLSEMTKKIRRAKGQSLPSSPLVGKGGLINHLEIVKDGNKFKLQPDNQMAVNRSPSGKVSRISWKRLWTIHEMTGAKISITNKMRTAFNAWWKIVLGHGVMKIPARHPLQKAYKRYINSKKFKDTNQDFSKAIKTGLSK